MKFQVYKKEDGTEEVRLRPETAADCDSIEDCGKCFFEDNIASVCENEIDVNNPPAGSALEFKEILKELGVELVVPRRTDVKPHEMTRYPQGFQIENLFEQLQKQIQPKAELLKKQKLGVGSEVEIRGFTVKDGKVITDPETREIMERLGLIEKIERQFAEDDN